MDIADLLITSIIAAILAKIFDYVTSQIIKLFKRYLVKTPECDRAFDIFKYNCNIYDCNKNICDIARKIRDMIDVILIENLQSNMRDVLTEARDCVIDLLEMYKESETSRTPQRTDVYDRSRGTLCDIQSEIRKLNDNKDIDNVIKYLNESIFYDGLRIRSLGEAKYFMELLVLRYDLKSIQQRLGIIGKRIDELV